MCVGLDLWQCFADFIVASKFYSEYCFGNSEGWRNRKGTEYAGVSMQYVAASWLKH